MRLALISTPRSGNTWLRHLLASIYGLHQYAAHEPRAVDWAGLPDDCIVQMHWRRSDEFVRLLANHRFEIVTIGRHPLDVLLSILHFCRKEPETRHWLLGEGGGESAIHGQTPMSPEFLAYSLGPRARALLSVTPDWWCRPDVTTIRYEHVVHDAVATLSTACSRIGPFNTDIAETVAALTIEKLRPTSQNDHFWQGRPGLWQELLPSEISEPIMQAHADTLTALGYQDGRSIPPTPQEAAMLWEQLV